MEVDPQVVRDPDLFFDQLPVYLLTGQSAAPIANGIQIWGTPDEGSVAESWWGAPLTQKVLLSGDPASGSGRLLISTDSVGGIGNLERARELVTSFAAETTVALPLVSDDGVISWHSSVSIAPDDLDRSFGKARQVLRLQYEHVERTTSMFAALLGGTPAVEKPSEDSTLYLASWDSWGAPSWEWTPTDLESVREVIRAHGGSVLEGQGEGIVAGLLNVTPIGADVGDEFAEFALITDGEHESAGPSILAALTLPVELDLHTLYGLNVAESSAPAAPVLGAWCPSPVSGRACFLSFAPEQLSDDLSLPELADLVARRAGWVATSLNS